MLSSFFLKSHSFSLAFYVLLSSHLKEEDAQTDPRSLLFSLWDPSHGFVQSMYNISFYQKSKKVVVSNLKDWQSVMALSLDSDALALSYIPDPFPLRKMNRFE